MCEYVRKIKREKVGEIKIERVKCDCGWESEWEWVKEKELGFG